MNVETTGLAAGPTKPAESSTGSEESGQAASATTEKENPAAASGTPTAPVEGSETEPTKKPQADSATTEKVNCSAASVTQPTVDTTTEGSVGRRGGAASVTKPSKEPPSASALVSRNSSSRRSHVYSMTNSILSAVSKNDLEGIVESVTFTDSFGVS